MKKIKCYNKERGEIIDYNPPKETSLEKEVYEYQKVNGGIIAYFEIDIHDKHLDPTFSSEEYSQYVDFIVNVLGFKLIDDFRGGIFVRSAFKICSQEEIYKIFKRIDVKIKELGLWKCYSYLNIIDQRVCPKCKDDHDGGIRGFKDDTCFKCGTKLFGKNYKMLWE